MLLLVWSEAWLQSVGHSYEDRGTAFLGAIIKNPEKLCLRAVSA
jgi:hypothetical protein